MKTIIRKTIISCFVLFGIMGSLLAAGCQQGTTGNNLASIATGGKLYDHWMETIAASTQEDENHPMWALQSTNTRTGEDTWRCKECHGWDYKGKDGVYGTGSHNTGFPGVYEASLNKTTAQLEDILKGKTDSRHNFSLLLGDTEINDLANFLKGGLVDHSKYIDYSTKKPTNADIPNGKKLFDSTCSQCHGVDGKKLLLDDGSLGVLANDNPWETLHKIRSGQPGTPMPSAIIYGWSMQNVVDTLGYAQSLPKQ